MSSHQVDVNKPLEYQDHQGHLNIIGFWIFLGAEVALFATLFATYFVMKAGGSDAGFHPADMFELPLVFKMTFLLLTSSFTCGLALHAMRQSKWTQFMVYQILTLLMGMGFVYYEVYEFVHYVSEGVNLGVGSYWSAFFVLLGTHGAHVSVGIIWIIGLLIQFKRMGSMTPKLASKFFVSSLYWHFLDVIWIFIYTGVYLFGIMQ
ncbi:cytochrome aa3 quinol oxidase subunit III [Brochothrix campestris]|uniref:Quinol oxidase subunit 3 n=1 Tax=Brochothrix campestris FSL F6-1037 TaxID=1265861 RepID=W7CSM2_9LIST|nr:cytochrome aa3 quinol oxidase subunit III [Brochothrix campestris]EUJ36018.1 cytochrome aa3 quinol oxidase subunit III [Brochothrix campestris FSL F6-1037]